MFRSLPLGRILVQSLHDLNAKVKPFAVRMRFPSHVLDTLVKTGVTKAQRAVPIVKQRMDRGALRQSGKSTIAPQDRGHVRRRQSQSFVSALKRTVTEL